MTSSWIISKERNPQKKLKRGYDFVFSQMDIDTVYIYSGTLQDFEWKKGCYECIDLPCGHYSIKRNEVKHYTIECINSRTNIIFDEYSG